MNTPSTHECSIARLAEYEDTGMTPQEIRNMKDTLEKVPVPVSVNVAMPTAWTEVLIFIKMNGVPMVRIGQVDHHGYWHIGENMYGWKHPESGDIINYWMPLPKYPEKGA